MKTTLLTRLALLGLCVLTLAAKPPEGAPLQNRPHETRMLHHLLQMEPEELTALRQTIERIERMAPEEKAHLLERIGKLDRMPPERLEALRERFEGIAPETRETMRRRWLEMTPEEHREWRQKLREMTPEQRAETLAEEGILPTWGDARKGPKGEE